MTPRRPPKPVVEPKIARHSYSAIFGTYADTPKFRELVSSMSGVGQLQPILLLNGQILDGWHRYLACLELGLEPKFSDFAGDESDALAHVLGLNVHRRQLSQSQVAVTAARLQLSCESAGIRLTQEQIRRAFRIGESVLLYATRVLRHGSPGIIAMVESGYIRTKVVQKLVAVTPHAEQERLAAAGRDAVRAAAAELRRPEREKASVERPARPEAVAPPPATHLGDLVNEVKTLSARVQAMAGTPEGKRLRSFSDQLGLRWFDGNEFVGLARVWRLIHVASDPKARPTLDQLRQLVRE